MKDKIIEDWLTKVDHDLIAVDHLLGLAEDAPTDVIAFHCQQAVEKSLKAFLTHKDVRAGRTHDIRTLLNLCIEVDEGFKGLDGDRVAELTFYAVQTRYPGDLVEIDLQETKVLATLARTVYDFVIGRIEKG